MIVTKATVLVTLGAQALINTSPFLNVTAPAGRASRNEERMLDGAAISS